MESRGGSVTHEILLNPRWPAEDLRFLRETAEEILRRHATEPSYVLSSSGTSAGTWRAIKLILLSRRAVEASASAVAKRFRLTASDRFAQLLPPFHVGGLGLETRARLVGAACEPLFGPDGRWDAEFFLRESKARGITVASLVPTQLHDVLRLQPEPWPELRCVWLGGAALSTGLERQARSLGWPLVPTYGMTETASMIAVREEDGCDLGFEILPHAAVEKTPEGRLRVRASSLATGYARRALDGALEWTPLSADGYVTEDHGDVRAGRLFVEGRGSEQIKVNGENVNLTVLRGILEEESVKRGVPTRDWHLLAMTDERRGACLVLAIRRGLPVADLRVAFEERVLPFERFQEIVEVEAIPRTELGKPREAELLNLLAARKS